MGCKRRSLSCSHQKITGCLSIILGVFFFFSVVLGFFFGLQLGSCFPERCYRALRSSKAALPNDAGTETQIKASY